MKIRSCFILLTWWKSLLDSTHKKVVCSLNENVLPAWSLGRHLGQFRQLFLISCWHLCVSNFFPWVLILPPGATQNKSALRFTWQSLRTDYFRERRCLICCSHLLLTVAAKPLKSESGLSVSFLSCHRLPLLPTWDRERWSLDFSVPRRMVGLQEGLLRTYLESRLCFSNPANSKEEDISP